MLELAFDEMPNRQSWRFVDVLYLWIKWLHILAIISWMAGILYLYRLLINHKERGQGKPDIHHLLVGMEYRLSRYITFPAMIVSILCGFGMMILQPEFLTAPWAWYKVLFVVGLVVSTVYADRLRISAAGDASNLPTGRRLRFLNEVPTILMAVIVWLVLFKP
jgi:putative membrane protein